MLITEAVPKATFANHESFHLRYGWLKKAYNQTLDDPRIFSRDDATIKLGVGKNMVRAIKFWGIASKILETSGSGKNTTTKPSEMGDIIFDDKNGLDPYLEKPDTLWLLHWLLYAKPCRIPVWWIIMNEFSATNVKIEDIIKKTDLRVRNISSWKPPSSKSIKKDVDVFIHTYTTRQDKLSMEDYLDCPFRQLKMIKQKDRDTIRFVFGKKFEISSEMMTFACLDFMERSSITSKTISVGRLATEPGGVGNIFKLSESDLAELLNRACDKHNSLSMQNINGAQHLVLNDSPKIIAKQMLAKAYDKKRLAPTKRIENEMIA